MKYFIEPTRIHVRDDEGALVAYLDLAMEYSDILTLTINSDILTIAGRAEDLPEGFSTVRTGDGVRLLITLDETPDTMIYSKTLEIDDIGQELRVVKDKKTGEVIVTLE